MAVDLYTAQQQVAAQSSEFTVSRRLHALIKDGKGSGDRLRVHFEGELLLWIQLRQPALGVDVDLGKSCCNKTQYTHTCNSGIMNLNIILYVRQIRRYEDMPGVACLMNRANIK